MTVFLHVSAQTAFDVEPPATIMALMELEVKMCVFVLSERGYVNEAVTAHLAGIWLFSCVCSLVNLQSTGTTERFVANFAVVRPLIRVSSMVQLQGTGSHKHFFAIQTLEISNSGGLRM